MAGSPGAATGTIELQAKTPLQLEQERYATLRVRLDQISASWNDPKNKKTLKNNDWQFLKIQSSLIGALYLRDAGEIRRNAGYWLIFADVLSTVTAQVKNGKVTKNGQDTDWIRDKVQWTLDNPNAVRGLTASEWAHLKRDKKTFFQLQAEKDGWRKFAADLPHWRAYAKLLADAGQQDAYTASVYLDLIEKKVNEEKSTQTKKK